MYSPLVQEMMLPNPFATPWSRANAYTTTISSSTTSSSPIGGYTQEYQSSFGASPQLEHDYYAMAETYPDIERLVNNALNSVILLDGRDMLRFTTLYGYLDVSVTEGLYSRLRLVDVCRELLWKYIVEHEQQSCQTRIPVGKQLELDLSV